MTRPALIAATTLVAVLLVAAPARANWEWPVSGDVITPYGNSDDPYAPGQHRGIDIAADLGTPVVAAAAGDVRFAGTVGSSGLTVSIRTADDLFDTSYLHLSSAIVRKGQPVAAGDVIGAVGTTGVRSANPAHLHFGVRDAGSRHAYHDPLAFLPPAGPSPERPRTAPDPIPVPVPRNPAPKPLPRTAPAPRRVPIPRSAPRRAPLPRVAPRRAPADRHAARPKPEPIPRVAPVARSAPAVGGAPSPHAAPHPRRIPATHDRPSAAGQRPLASADGGAGADSAPGSAALRSGAPATMHRPAGDSGPDLGWALACVGLLVAAAILGLSEQGRSASRRGRHRVSGVLRPLWGRR
jgi:hypothetical protein